MAIACVQQESGSHILDGATWRDYASTQQAGRPGIQSACELGDRRNSRSTARTAVDPGHRDRPAASGRHTRTHRLLPRHSVSRPPTPGLREQPTLVEREGVEPPRMNRPRIYSPVHFLLRVLSENVSSWVISFCPFCHGVALRTGHRSHYRLSPGCPYRAAAPHASSILPSTSRARRPAPGTDPPGRSW